MAEMSDASAAGLLLFMDWTIDRGELNPVTAGSIRTACRRILEDEGPADALDLRNADVEGIIHRFTNKRRGDFKEDSLNTYASRFRQAVEMYLTYLDGGAWRPKRSRRAPTGRSTTSPEVSQREERGARPASAAREQPVGGAGPSMITYPLPIRPGIRGQLSVPEDLTASEARRVASIVAAIALEADQGQTS